MQIGVVEGGWWQKACEAANLNHVSIPCAAGSAGQPYSADLAARIAWGERAAPQLAEAGVELILDNGGQGLGFVPGAGGQNDLKLLHEYIGAPLVSHFIDPLVTVFQGLTWPTAWQCLQSQTWVKPVWDRAQGIELARFGVPHVVHLPLAAPDRHYPTDPIDLAQVRPIVSFVGAQNTGFFAQGSAVSAQSLMMGALAHAVRGDLPNATFYEVYHDAYRVAEEVKPDDAPEARLQKTTDYFASKLYYNAALAIRARDRFVIFLSKHLGERFELIGPRWDQLYGLPTRPALPSYDEYLNHFRRTAINLNFVNGNAETGLNMRHFEITAAGGFLLCYDHPELHDCFEVGRECDVFKNENDLLQKIDYYLGHPEERAAIAAAGQRRALAQHLFSHRLQSLLGSLQVRKSQVEFSTNHWAEDLRSLVPQADVVLDCGANVGQMAESLRNLYPQAEIYSFEPVAGVFEKLRSRCAPINVKPVHKAVGDFDGTAAINLTAGPEAHSLLGFQENNPCAKWTRVVGTEEVEVCTLDHWCRDSGIDPSRVHVIKLDVQGAELKALSGARNILKHARAVFSEVSFVPLYKDTPLIQDVDEFMTDCGFTRHAVYPSDQPQHWADALYVRADLVGQA